MTDLEYWRGCSGTLTFKRKAGGPLTMFAPSGATPPPAYYENFYFFYPHYCLLLGIFNRHYRLQLQALFVWHLFSVPELYSAGR